MEITALSPGLFKNTSDAAAFRREMDEVYPRAAEWAHRWKLPGLIVFGFHKPGATEANAGSDFRAPIRRARWWSGSPRRGSGRAADGLTLMIEPEPICWCDTGRGDGGPDRARRRRGAVRSTTIREMWRGWRIAIRWTSSTVVAPWIANVHVKDLRPLTRGAGFRSGCRRARG